MITGFIFDTLPVFLAKLGNTVKNSFIYSIIAGIYRLISKAFRKSFIYSIFAHHESEESLYEASAVCKLFDRIFSFILRVIRSVIGVLSFKTYDSLFISIGSKICGRFKFLDFEFVIGAVLLFMFICPGELWGNIYALILSVLLVGIMLTLMALKHRETLKVKSVGIPFVLFVISSVAGIGTAANKTEALRVFLFFFSAFLFSIVLIGAITDTKKLQKVQGFIYAAVIITALIGFMQRIMGVAADASYTDLTLNAGMPGRVYSTFDNPNNYAEFIILMFPMALAFCIAIKDRVKKLLAFVSLVLPIGALLMTYSRSGWISFAVAVIVFIFLWNKKLLPLLIIAGILCIPILPESIYNRILTIGSTKDTSNSYRLYIWEAVLHVIRNEGITGVGLGSGNFRPEYLIYADNAALAAMHSHMLYLELWVEMGILGIITYLSYYITTIRNSVIALRNASATVRYTLIGGVSALVGIAFICAAEYIWFYPRVMFTFFILTGIMAATANITKNR